MTTPAPWLTEPDRLEWTHEGYPCLAVRNSFGAWCGYVGVPEGHPWYERCEADLADVQTKVRWSMGELPTLGSVSVGVYNRACEELGNGASVRGNGIPVGELLE